MTNIEQSEKQTSSDSVKCKKSSFKDKESANKHIIWLQANSTRESIPRRAYLCDKCSTWHLTSKPKFSKAEIVEKRSKASKVAPEEVVDYPSLIKELTAELIEKNQEIEAMTKQLNKMYKEIYELNEIIKNQRNNEKRNK